MSAPRIGTDEWVSQVDGRRRQEHPLIGSLRRLWLRLPRPLQIVLLLILPAVLPLVTNNAYILGVLTLVWLYATLATGLNIVVGYTGMLDLGYVAFFGLGGYVYAWLSSDHLGVHLPTIIVLPIVLLITTLAGVLIGLPSLRLTGDYLAIVTLGFGQIFVQLMRAMNKVNLPGASTPIDISGGPNGIPNLDRLSLFGATANTVTSYYYILLFLLAVVLLLVFHLNRSRLGRAWRAIREDALAAEAMGIPTRRLRLLSFAIGAGIAGICGAVFAAYQQAVFPQNFEVTLLINLYAMVVLGGVGSLSGMVAGALIITVLPEVLRPGQRIAGTELNAILFYGGVLAFLAVMIRPRWQLLAILAGTILGGMVLRGALAAIFPGMLEAGDGVGFSALVQNWLALPDSTRLASDWGNLLFFVVIAVIVITLRLQRRWRPLLLGVILYLLAFVWETRLSEEPSTTRLLLVGAILVILMNVRPQGIFGQKRVEIG